MPPLRVCRITRLISNVIHVYPCASRGTGGRAGAPRVTMSCVMNVEQRRALQRAASSARPPCIFLFLLALPGPGSHRTALCAPGR
jgi:hypothetical protein